MRKETAKRIIRVIRKTILIILITQVVYLFLCKWLYPPITITQLGSLIGTWNDTFEFRRDYISYDSISPNVKLAVLAAEDLHFYKHDGIDWWNVEKAQKYNRENPDKPPMGASSISQQTAKNVFLWQGRSWVRKGLEVYFTKLIEWTWGKKRILATYLNVIEMGNGIYGIEAAAQYYFRKKAKDLTEQEAALIAVCLPSPKLYKPDQLNEKLQKRYDQTIYYMNLLKEYPAVQELIK